MSAPMGKNRKNRGRNEEPTVVKFQDVNIFIVERKIQRVRFEHLKKLARRKGFRVADSIELDEDITHIVAELDHREDVLEAISSKLKASKDGQAIAERRLESAEVVCMDWFTACMEEQKPVEVKDEHRLKAKPKVVAICPSSEQIRNSGYQDARFACQRRTPLKHHNKLLTDALESLEKHAEFLGGDQNQSRALAFRKASAALKALPKPVRSMRDVQNLYDLRGGKHCKKVIQELIEDGFSTEIDNIREDKWFQTMEVFTGVFGCGAATSRKWYDKDLRTLKDVLDAPDVSLTKEQRKGVEFYDDLNTPVNRIEAEVIRDLVVEETERILPGTTVVITGGFIRGKESGHDVDLLMSHPEDGKEESLLAKLLKNLHKRELLEYTDIQNSSFTKEVLSRPAQARRSHLDHYERCFSIFRLPKHLIEQKKHTKKQNGSSDAETSAVKDIDDDSPAPKQMKLEQTNVDNRGVGTSESRSWVARRVDLIIAPASQYAYALMGWTGSRMFNRSIRDYANKEMNMTLTSHGLYDKVNFKSLPADTEEDIFNHLKLEYREPVDRNC
ncbi:DNA nucleotidylexotransferase-like [Amphiura filiformis]|uniref:DNA nucleotidylexotransferase-like n=1 Tax=Amphiura filiformis TaxID=82378 RepID=UPI003B21818C